MLKVFGNSCVWKLITVCSWLRSATSICPPRRSDNGSDYWIANMASNSLPGGIGFDWFYAAVRDSMFHAQRLHIQDQRLWGWEGRSSMMSSLLKGKKPNMLNTSAAPPTAIGISSWDAGLPSVLADICHSGNWSHQEKGAKIKGILGVMKTDNFRVWFSS